MAKGDKRQTLLVDVDGRAIHIEFLCPPFMIGTAEVINGEVLVSVWDAVKITECRRLLRGSEDEKRKAYGEHLPELIEQVEKEIGAESDAGTVQ